LLLWNHLTRLKGQNIFSVWLLLAKISEEQHPEAYHNPSASAPKQAIQALGIENIQKPMLQRTLSQ
jgi:hypothetical protein